jgi:hypothetical protein
MAMLAGRHAEAAALLLRALDASVGMGYSSETALTLRWAARLAHLAGRSRASATLWRSAGRTRGDVVDALLDRGDIDADLGATDAPALAQTDAVAMARTELSAIREPPATREPGRDPGANLLRLEGAVWEVVFDGAVVRLPDMKGMHDLAVLLARPGREVHCTELMGAAVEQADIGPVLDAQARRAYEAKIVELQGELAEAEDFGDTGRAEKLRTDMELLLAELAAATGFGGRARHAGASTDRVRSAVSQRIRATLRRLEELHPPLGRHLRAAVHTGTWCAYRPDSPVRWEL